LNADHGHPTFDRHVDAPVPSVIWPDYSEIRSYYRVVVNPFLAVLAWLAALGLIRLTIHWRRPWLLLLALLVLCASSLLFQFHCLDCGKTGYLHRLGRHRCDRVWLRWHTGTAERWRCPTAPAQLMIWCYVAVGAAVLIWALAYANL
jgi:hypothetical protein